MQESGCGSRQLLSGEVVQGSEGKGKGKGKDKGKGAGKDKGKGKGGFPDL